MREPVSLTSLEMREYSPQNKHVLLRMGSGGRHESFCGCQTDDGRSFMMATECLPTLPTIGTMSRSHRSPPSTTLVSKTPGRLTRTVTFEHDLAFNHLSGRISRSSLITKRDEVDRDEEEEKVAEPE